MANWKTMISQLKIVLISWVANLTTTPNIGTHRAHMKITCDPTERNSGTRILKVRRRHLSSSSSSQTFKHVYNLTGLQPCSMKQIAIDNLVLVLTWSLKHHVFGTTDQTTAWIEDTKKIRSTGSTSSFELVYSAQVSYSTESKDIHMGRLQQLQKSDTIKKSKTQKKFL